jgi:hypothetical protein
MVNYGWSGGVTPKREDCTFEPSNRVYTSVTEDQTRDYTATKLTYIVSGTVTHNGAALSNVVLNGLPANPVTNESGYYCVTVGYNWSGMVTPIKKGYTFEPANKTHDAIIAHDTQNYDATETILTYTISGSITCDGTPLKGVSLSVSNPEGVSITNTNGEYEILVNQGWSGTVKPIKEGYIFDSVSMNYSNVTANQTEQNYTSKLLALTISGKVIQDEKPIEGVSVSADNGGGNDVTDANGAFKVQVDYGWSGQITLEKEGYVFMPCSKTYTNVTPDHPDADIFFQDSLKSSKVDIVDNTVLSKTTQKPLVKDENIPLIKTKKEPSAPRNNNIAASVKNIMKEQPVNKNIPALPKKKKPLVTKVFIDTDIHEVIRYIALKTGAVIVPDQTVVGRVTCKLKEVPLEKALDIILAQTNYIVKKAPDYYLICSWNPESEFKTELEEILSNLKKESNKR